MGRWLALFSMMALMAEAQSLVAAGIPVPTDAPGPLTPEESAKRFQLAPGFRIELVAAEPHVADPVAIDFDAHGRMFVAEIHGYNLEGYLDVLELNKTGVLDKAVRRIAANPEAIKKAEQEQYGTVKVLEDADGDGRMDRAAVWADRLPPCYGVVAARDGVVALCAPDIYFLADRDGDGKAEVREKLFSGFGLYDLWSRINNPRWGVDNWIYAANGINSGGTIEGPRLAQPVRLPATAFRFKPDGSALEPTSGSSSGFGLAIDDWGDRFMVANQQHVLYVVPLEHRYLARNPYYAAPGTTENICSYGHPARLYPTSQPDPWRLERSKDPAWVQFYGVAEATANGYFTAASGQAIYQGVAFPPEYWGNHFSVDNAQNLIHRCVLVPQGAGYLARRPREDEKTEFLTSTEQWFRPVNLMTGPEGALYIVDMYRAIIEDYSAIPRYLQQIYIESLIAGADKGRIWRVVPTSPPLPLAGEGPGVRAAGPLAARSGAELVSLLSHPNAWQRKTAQRLLVDRGDRSVAPSLVALVLDGKTPQARMHALYTLDGLGALDPSVVERALRDAHHAVRTHALALAERWLDQHAGVTEKAVAMADDPSPRVRLQAALSLGQSKDPRAIAALRKLAARYGNDRWMRSAVLSSVGESADRVLAAILAGDDEPGESGAMVHPLASIVAARHNDEELGRV
ncbi:MAG: HEAT repeat domain-containing protein, partial [Thermoguttaceae bacterium]|nr:HEAT repeat domain-containing protein [Thermoguttaceae bacterium]